MSILIGGTIGSTALKRATKISGSRWRQESVLLVQMGLMSYNEKKEIRDDGIRRVKYYSLTQKGIEVARHVQAMTHLLVQEHLPEAVSPTVRISA